LKINWLSQKIGLDKNSRFRPLSSTKFSLLLGFKFASLDRLLHQDDDESVEDVILLRNLSYQRLEWLFQNSTDPNMHEGPKVIQELHELFAYIRKMASVRNVNDKCSTAADLLELIILRFGLEKQSMISSEIFHLSLSAKWTLLACSTSLSLRSTCRLEDFYDISSWMNNNTVEKKIAMAQLIELALTSFDKFKTIVDIGEHSNFER
jgi:hypothetical protein